MATASYDVACLDFSFRPKENVYSKQSGSTQLGYGLKFVANTPFLLPLIFARAST